MDCCEVFPTFTNEVSFREVSDSAQQVFDNHSHASCCRKKTLPYVFFLQGFSRIILKNIEDETCWP